MFYSFIAMAQSAQNGDAQGGGMLMWLPMILIFVIMYFLILRPASKRQKDQVKLLDSLSKGDKIVTNGGIHGTIVRANDGDPVIMVKIAENVKVEMDRGAVARKMKTNE